MSELPISHAICLGCYDVNEVRDGVLVKYMCGVTSEWQSKTIPFQTCIVCLDLAKVPCTRCGAER